MGSLTVITILVIAAIAVMVAVDLSRRVSALSHDVYELQEKTKTLPHGDIAAELDALKACIESWRKQTVTTQEWVNGVDDYCNVSRDDIYRRLGDLASRLDMLNERAR